VHLNASVGVGACARVHSACCVSTSGERIKPAMSRVIVNAPCPPYDPKFIRNRIHIITDKVRDNMNLGHYDKF